MSRTDKLVLASVCGILAVATAAFLYYWLKVRDTWEIENFSKVHSNCDKLLDALNRADDDAAALAHQELNTLIGPRNLRNQHLIERVDATREAFGPAGKRIDAKRLLREASEQKERERREQVAKHEREERERDQAARRPKERYYRDSKGEVVSESDIEFKLWEIRSKIRSMPDNLERAGYEGYLQAVEAEWARIKRQGPIYER